MNDVDKAFEKYWLFQTTIGNTSPEDKESTREGFTVGSKQARIKAFEEVINVMTQTEKTLKEHPPRLIRIRRYIDTELKKLRSE